jgi:hypothetical protein
VPKIADSSRLPDRLWKWKGFIDPKTDKLYDYETRVKKFRDFAPVGGGIHMGDKAIPLGNLDFFSANTWKVFAETALARGMRAWQPYALSSTTWL